MNFINFAYEQQKIVTDGLILNLDAGNISSYSGTGSTWYDLSNSNNNGIIHNGSTFNLSNGGSITINPSFSQYISFNSTLGNGVTSSYSWGGWFNSSNAALYGTAPNANNWCMNLAYDGINLQWGMYVVTTVPSTSAVGFVIPAVLIPNTWYHLMGVWKAGVSLSVYVNGTLLNTLLTSTNTLRTPASGWGIGSIAPSQYNQASTGTFNVYKRVLTQQEISQNFNALRGRYGL